LLKGVIAKNTSYNQLTFTPFFILSDGEIMDNLSPSRAASNIPFEISPRIDAGSRFTTITTCRPIKSSIL